MSESSELPGLYTFSIPSSFFTTNGVGVYPVVVEVNITATPRVVDVVSRVIRVNVNDFDSLWSQVIDGSVSALTVLKRLNAWVRGKITLTGDDAAYFAEDGVSTIYTNRKSDTERTPQ